jgi:hypothetical protein
MLSLSKTVIYEEWPSGPQQSDFEARNRTSTTIFGNRFLKGMPFAKQLHMACLLLPGSIRAASQPCHFREADARNFLGGWFLLAPTLLAERPNWDHIPAIRSAWARMSADQVSAP